MCAQRLLQLQLSAAFQTWQERAVELANKKQTASKALAHLQSRTLGSAFLTWAEAAQQAQQARDYFNTKALAFWTNRAAAAAFTTWQPWAARRAELRLKLQGVLLLLVATRLGMLSCPPCTGVSSCTSSCYRGLRLVAD